jgi:cysteine desulfurase / selenocysteine lyase
MTMIDDAVIDRIARSLHAELPGAPAAPPTPTLATAALPDIVPDDALTARARGLHAEAPNPPSVRPPRNAAVSGIPSGSSSIPGVVLPSTPSGFTAPQGLERPAVPNIDGAIPSLLDERAAVGGVPASGAPAYYFLTARSPHAELPGAPVHATPPSAAGLPHIADVPGSPSIAALPSARLPGIPPGASIPDVGFPGAPFDFATPRGLERPALTSIDGALPRLFDEHAVGGGVPTSGAPGYYFLTPTLAETAPPIGRSFARRTFDVRDIRRDFPILQERIHGRQLVWLDNAATTQKPRAVIDRIVRYYEHEYSNVHRAAHTLAARSTDAYEHAREVVQRFIGAGSVNEIVFVRGTTEGVNLVANSWGRKNIIEGDEIVLTTLEHHSNIVPWQFLADDVGAVLKIVPVSDRGEVLLGDYEKLLGPKTRFVAMTHVSNALGTILPVREMVQMAHRYDARVLVDGAQAVSHFPVNVQTLDADFYVFSGHKIFGPSAIGVVYGKQAILEAMPPWQGGGNMIQRVTFEKSTFADPPFRFEAGTAALAPAVGLGAALEYLEQLGMENVARHEHELLVHATDALGKIAGLHLIGTAPDKAGVVSFIADGFNAEDIGKALDEEGIAVRAGHHCAQPTMDRFGVTSTVRPSFALYNTHEEVERLAAAVRRILRA